ncbi:zf-TFIIB domain-containing protein [Pseudobacteriovorax antillogorgiicola]|uniref:Transcription factor zinc-finger n=1 Tax=Pseudobacteriovorax antillogorgiicola TaxID=1513793 RepID=A0A1Y6BJ72_9BACT|nr:zf-TFIIB domain-containing protein [Pseudobacteriovorax antillogorgiicola]TCS55440.1 TFIIB-like protein [Pseudobacteriovorax antillogorgiicola]SMF12429.1 Transcription factor zinc-finger [Pseudobacteriovorax antillogorgiicola]
MAKQPGSSDLDKDIFWSDIHKYVEQKKLDIEKSRGILRHEKVRKCPNCSKVMAVESLYHVLIDRCQTCGGIFLDEGELELLFKTKSESGFIASLKRFLKP